MCSVGQVVSKEMIQSHLSSSIRFHSKDISFEHSDISRIVVLHKHLTVPLIRLWRSHFFFREIAQCDHGTFHFLVWVKFRLCVPLQDAYHTENLNSSEAETMDRSWGDVQEEKKPVLCWRGMFPGREMLTVNGDSGYVVCSVLWEKRGKSSVLLGELGKWGWQSPESWISLQE